MTQKKNKITITDSSLGHSGAAAIHSENPDVELEMNRVTFDRNPIDICAPQGMGRLNMNACLLPGSRPLRRSKTKRGSPTASSPNRVAGMPVSLRWCSTRRNNTPRLRIIEMFFFRSHLRSYL